MEELTEYEKITKRLADIGLKVVWQDDDECASVIDFTIADDEDNLAWVWGDTKESVEWECNHPDEAISFGEDDERGTCTLCGATCDWHWISNVVDEGHDEDGVYYARSGKEREIEVWHYEPEIGGIIKDIIKEIEIK